MSQPPTADGVLVVDKPEGPTSHDVVAVARRALGVSRVGHTGTLDPMATGVLALMLGRATRLAQFLGAGIKSYEASIRFGVTTDTYDRHGTITSTSGQRPSLGQLEDALEPFRGTFEQTPPAYSAKNIEGTRAYERARKHGVAAVRPRPVSVTVSRLELRSFDGGTARVSVDASAGFYVRSLAHDLGVAVGTGAVLDALRRTQSGDFTLDQAIRYDDLVAITRESLARHLLPFDGLLSNRPSVVVDGEGQKRVRHGLDVGPFSIERGSGTVRGAAAPQDNIVRIIGVDGRLIALAKPVGDRGFLHASIVFG